MQAHRKGQLVRCGSVALAIALLLAASACKQAHRTGAEAGDAAQPGAGSTDPGTKQPLPKPPQPPEWPSSSDTPPPGTACDDMTAAQCLLATRCVLEAVPRGDPGYVCREAKGPCEGGKGQFPALAFKAHCEALPGCRYVPADCFCPTAQTRVRSTPVAINCACSGGPPHRCVAEAAGR